MAIVFRTWKGTEAYTSEDLDYMYDDDTVDVKNFCRMPECREKREFRRMLKKRVKWYLKRGLDDWAEQVEVALDIDKGVYDG